MSDDEFDLTPPELDTVADEPTPADTRRDRRHRSETRRLAKMHGAYGRNESHTCGDCAFLIVKQYAGRYFKCLKYGNTAGDATDWRMKWTACGAFSPREEKGSDGH